MNRIKIIPLHGAVYRFAHEHPALTAFIVLGWLGAFLLYLACANVARNVSAAAKYLERMAGVWRENDSSRI